MKIGVVSSSKASVANFKGVWKNRKVGSYYSGQYITERTYVPDKNESLKDVAKAWKEETGLYPCDWIKKNNVYNQSGNVHYKYADYHYMPLNLIKASLDVRYSELGNSSYNTDYLIENAKIAKQADNDKEVEKYDNLLLDLITKTYGAKFINTLEIDINNYKPGLGSDLFMKQKYHY